MKIIFSFLMAGTFLAFTACNNNSSDVKGMDGKDSAGETKEMSSDANSAEAKEERNKQTALASVEGINRHDVNAVLKDAAPDGVDYGDGNMPPSRGLDSMKAGLESWLKAFPDAKGENLKAVADGEWVMIWGDWSGTWKGDFMGQKATGKSYKVKDVDIFRFNEEGKITEHHYVQSWMSIAPQIGMKMQ